MKFSVLGAGSWGTTLANLLCENGHTVKIWAREPEVVEGINLEHRNPYFVNHLELNHKLIAFTDIIETLSDTDYALISIPSGFIRPTLESYSDELASKKGIINVAKGFERETGKRLSQILCDIVKAEPESPQDRIAVLSGPNLADEIAMKKISASVVACHNEELAKIFQECLSNEQFRVYRQTDRTGVELGGTLKNIFAIGAGICDGLELGDNAKAAYLTRSLHELVRLGTALGGEKQTFYGLAGLGDLMATTSSPLSRNNKLGREIAKGKTLREITESTKMVLEGVETTKIAFMWGKKLTLPLPITEELYRVLFENRAPQIAAHNLMSRTLKSETD
ncbi:MAG: NAD(P)H-dependent glycerol-3-phosphate dehydrogenase [Candidatus Rifleibacteriota bacterium]